MAEPNVIKTIKDMLSKGESEEKIIETLKSLGVEEKQIKNLILVSQANTFDLILSETKKETINYLEEHEEETEQKILENVLEKNKELIAKTTDDFVQETKEKQNKFEQNINKKSETISDIVNDMKQKVDQQKKDINTLDYKIEHFTPGQGKTAIFKKIALGIGIILVLVAIAKFIMMGSTATLDFILIYILSLLAGIVLVVTGLW
jgi:hypothetical protein